MFAQELANGKSLADAYVLAGFRPNPGNACTLKKNKTILNRIAEILEERESSHKEATAAAIEATALSKEWVIRNLIENVERAMMAKPVTQKQDGELVETGEYKYEGAVANRALELLGKELGMFIERRDVRTTQTTVVDLSDADLVAVIRDALGSGRGDAEAPKGEKQPDRVHGVH